MRVADNTAVALDRGDYDDEDEAQHEGSFDPPYWWFDVLMGSSEQVVR